MNPQRNNIFTEFKSYIGLGRGVTSLKEKIVAAVTGLLGIMFVYLAGQSVGAHEMLFADSFVLIPIAASTVLLFSVPHGALSQPWSVIGGNVLSAAVGVSCSEYIDSTLLAASAAVGGAIFVMHYFKCVHPPGGATALSAVLGGEAIQNLGFYFILFPVLFSAVLMVILAIVLNYPFKWRLYPAHLFHKRNKLPHIDPSQRRSEITLEDFIAAVDQHDSYIDMTEDSWVELFELAKQNAEKGTLHPTEIDVGAFYSNGKLGKEWSIRKVLRVTSQKRNRAKEVTFQVVVGNDLNKQQQCSVEQFRAWAKFEVNRVNNYWEKSR